MKLIPVVALALALVGCAGVPSGNETRAKQHAERIDNALQNGDFPLAMSMTETLAGSHDFSAFYQLLHDESTLALREHYITELLNYAQPDGSTARIYFAIDSADRLRLHRILQSDSQLSDVKTSIDALAAVGNRNGAAPFLLSDNFSALPSLQTPEQMKVVFERSVQVLGQHPDAKDALMVPVMDYALDKGEKSSEFQSVAAVLGKLNITRQDQLRLIKRFRPDIVADLFPKVVVIKDYSIPETQLKYILDFELKDSESARFRNISASRGDGGLHICGQVNAKNSYGGYIGYRPFYIRQDNGATRVLMDAEKEYQATEQCAEHQLFP